MNRRTFTRTLVLGGLGAIFVPKYERWFRPLAVTPKVLTLPWPEAAPGDLAVVSVWGGKGLVTGITMDGWTLLQRRADHQGDVAMFYRRVGQEPRSPLALPKGAQAASLLTFRNAAEPGILNVMPRREGVRLTSEHLFRPILHVGHSSTIQVGRPTASWVARG